MNCEHIPRRAWFHITCPGDINDDWPHVHLYECAPSGVQTALTDEQVDEIVRHLRKHYAGVPLTDVEAAFIGRGGVIEYSDGTGLYLRLSLLSQAAEDQIRAQIEDCHIH